MNRFRLTLSFIRSVALIVALVLVAGNIGYRLGQKNVGVSLSEKKIVVNTTTPASRDIDFGLFWDVWERLEKSYLDKEKLDHEQMVYGAISGMVNALGDPYTVFLPPKENEEFKNDLSGSFEGIGAQLGAKDDKIVVIAPLKDHPAEKAGVKAGDWIVKVDGVDTFGWTVPEAVTKIRGPKGSTVILSIVHEGESAPIDISVARDTIVIKSVEFEIKTPAECNDECTEVGYIKLSRFGDQTNDEWNQAIAGARKQGSLSGVILDMRNNPGGYFQSAIYVASEFIPSGVIVVQENSDGTRETYSVTRVGNLFDIPLVVLINKGSASASEIVAGALHDHDRATLIGETTFGKGSIQTPEDLEGGAGLHITTARWILPDGEWINGTGIKPDIEVTNPTATDSADLQLERAIEELTK